VRDDDGVSIALLPAERLRALREVARAAANLAQIEQALMAAPGAGLPLSGYGDWPWLATLDVEELNEFVSTLREAIIVSEREGVVSTLEELLRRWRVTAQALDDPLRRRVLLGTPRDEDFVEVSRPE
jgi:hypothetical protein